jgi:methionyl-tRNA formyltransferase
MIPNQGYLDFNWSYEKLDRFVRATDFRPFDNQFTYSKVKIVDEFFIVNKISLDTRGPHSFTPGEVVTADDNNLKIAINYAIINILETMSSNQIELSINQLINNYKIRVGDILTNTQATNL